MDISEGRFRIIPEEPVGPACRRRITVLSKMWTSSSFSVAIRRQPFSGSKISCAHLFSRMICGGCSVAVSRSMDVSGSDLDNDGDARSAATSLALNLRQSLLMVGVVVDSSWEKEDDPPRWQPANNHFVFPL